VSQLSTTSPSAAPRMQLRCADARPFRRRLSADWPVVLLSLFVTLSLLTACTTGPQRPAPSPDGYQALAADLAAALQSGDFSGLAIDGDPQAALKEYQDATETMRGTLPTSVSVGEIRPDGKHAIANLNQSYDFGNGSWAFTSSAEFRYAESAKSWRVVWRPSIIHPELTEQTRLVHDRVAPRRGNIVDRNGKAIVEYRPVYEVGIDKTKIPPEQAADSARALAELVKIDADGYAAQVAASGPQAFVLAITLRAGQVPEQIDAIPGAVALGTSLPLAPTASFARNLLGSVAQASAEDVANSGGKIKAGDLVGQYGLQRSQDAVLRGTPGHTITLNYRPGAKPAGKPATPTAQPSKATTPSSVQTPISIPATLFSLAPVNGKQLQLTLDMDLQAKLEDEMTRRSGIVTATMIDVQSGGILATANSGDQNGMLLSTTGRYAPGSTLKVASSLAYLRRGLTPDSTVLCSGTTIVNGREIANHPGYPESKVGWVPLREALVDSCNTAFVNGKFSAAELASAAASLGVGVDYDIGFDAFFGQVPMSEDPIVRAANSFGQGDTLMSSMASAGMSASVAAGRTVIPHLIYDQVPSSSAQPLTPTEAAQLQDMMKAVVDRGTADHYKPWLIGGKTGSAEFNVGDAVHAHAWITGYNERAAISIMDYDGGTIFQFFPIFDTLLK